jgi:hypothetical protein
LLERDRDISIIRICTIDHTSFDIERRWEEIDHCIEDELYSFVHQS